MYKIMIDNRRPYKDGIMVERWHYEGNYQEIMQDIKERFLNKGKTVSIYQAHIIGGDGILYMVWIEEEEDQIE